MAAQEAAHAIFGAAYFEGLRPYMDLLGESAHRRHLTPLEAALAMANDLVASGRSPLMVLAAYVELAEPKEGPLV